MSIKKTILLSVLLYLNVFILGHNVIPHHHHGFGKICVLNFHCEDCKKSQNHEHHNLNIDEFYIPADDDSRSNTNCDCSQELWVLIETSLNTQDFVLIHFLLNPDIHFHSDFVAQSLRLRAPPVS